MSLYKAIGMMIWMLNMMMMMMMMMAMMVMMMVMVLWERFESKTTDRAEKAKTCEEPGGHLEKRLATFLALTTALC